MKKIFIILILALLVATGVQAQTIIDRSQVAVSPFFQVIPGEAAAGGFYSFMAFTHPSLSTAISKIGITVSAEGASSGQFVGGSSITFTVGAGELHKVFIVSTNHSSINPTALSTARDHFITTTSGSFTTGNVRVLSTNSTPTVSPSGDGKFNNLNQISMWGTIFSEATNGGFAMEFIGDMHDSTVLGDGSSVVPASGARGVN